MNDVETLIESHASKIIDASSYFAGARELGGRAPSIVRHARAILSSVRQSDSVAAGISDDTPEPTFRKCAECGRPTRGAFGPAPANNFWPSICQSCKDEADKFALSALGADAAARLERSVRKSFGLPTND